MTVEFMETGLVPALADRRAGHRVDAARVAVALRRGSDPRQRGAWPARGEADGLSGRGRGAPRTLIKAPRKPVRRAPLERRKFEDDSAVTLPVGEVGRFAPSPIHVARFRSGLRGPR